jgi:hypothetical protein
VNCGGLVSKWVGDTPKNIDALFQVRTQHSSFRNSTRAPEHQLPGFQEMLLMVPFICDMTAAWFKLTAFGSSEQEARAMDAILVFDEAESLFGSRADSMSSSTDR